MTKRRRFTLEIKRQLIAEAVQPGASVASVAMAHGINPNQMHNWRRELARMGAQPAVPNPALVPVTIVDGPAAPVASRPDVVSDGLIEVVFPRARLLLHGSVNVDVLQAALSILVQQ